MAAAASPERLSVADTGLLVIDVQEKLLPEMHEPELFSLVRADRGPCPGVLWLVAHVRYHVGV